VKLKSGKAKMAVKLFLGGNNFTIIFSKIGREGVNHE